MKDKLQKIANIALCVTARQEEQDAAACAFFRTIRSKCKTYEDMVKLLIPEQHQEVIYQRTNVTNLDADTVRAWMKAFGKNDPNCWFK